MKGILKELQNMNEKQREFLDHSVISHNILASKINSIEENRKSIFDREPFRRKIYYEDKWKNNELFPFPIN